MRVVPENVRRGLETTAHGDVLLAFVTVEHENLGEPIRVVNDVVDYILDGETYTGVLFGFKLMPDGEGVPSTDTIIPNVDRRIGLSLRPVSGRATVSLDIYSSVDFDLTANPRIQHGTPTRIYGWTNFELIEVENTESEVTGKLILRDASQEQWPGISATQSRVPGAYR